MKKIGSLVLLAIAVSLTGCKEGTNRPKEPKHTAPKSIKPPHIVFVTGDEEYRSEESMPMLAKLAKRELNATVTICYALDSLGTVDPNRADHIAGLEALDTADLMVIFTRFRALPESERMAITDYAESGRPIVGFRTATHTFKYEDPALAYWNNDWPTKVFGQQWITHHGHFDDGMLPVTEVYPMAKKHPILNGFNTIKAYSWLYHVDGGDWKLYGDSEPILEGRSLKSQHQMDGKLDEYPLTNPVAWTKTYTGSAGIKARVFFTTLGHPFDFKLPEVRKIALNGMYWALGRASEIPAEGAHVALDFTYEPNNSGFGKKFKPNLKPVQIE